MRTGAVRHLRCVLALLAAVLPRGVAEARDESDVGAPRAVVERAVADPSGARAGEPAQTAHAEEFLGGIIISEDSVLRRRVDQAASLSDRGRHEDAAQALGRLAESLGDCDRFLRTGDQTFISAKVEVQRLIGASPAEARAAYELAFGPAARRMLDQAPDDSPTVRLVASRYTNTRAGAEALYRLAVLADDEGAFAEAAALFHRLRATHPGLTAANDPNVSLRLAAALAGSGDRIGAESAINGLIGRAPDEFLDVAGERERRRLAEIPRAELFRHVARRRSSHVTHTPHPGLAGVAPAETEEPFLVPRWSTVPADAESDPRRGHRIGAELPAYFPAIAGDLVLVPGRHGLSAYDLATGARRWEYASASLPAPGVGAGRGGSPHGRLSTDGRTVYLIEAGRAAETFRSGPAPPWERAQPQAFDLAGGRVEGRAAVGGATVLSGVPGSPVNVLTALDVVPPRQAKRRWQVGGSSGGDEPLVAGHAFLGPPLAVSGRLYAVAERDATVRLVALDAASGRLEWSLDLAQSEIPISADPERRRIGATPTLTAGTLLCPTAGWATVAVDLAGRSLLWGFRFPRASPPAAGSPEDGNDAVHAETRWVDGTVRVAGGRVLLTPPEADELFCLDLRTGGVLWQRPRGENLFAAAATAERVLLIGRSEATLLNSSDGSSAGPAIPFSSHAVPSGCGYDAGSAYVQPLSDGSLLRIELPAGGATTIAGRQHSGTALGNLRWHGGTLLSLGPDFLKAFDGRDSMEATTSSTLANRPSDPTALLRRADLLAEAGRYAEAIDHCRRAVAAAGSPSARNRLIAALLDGVRHGLPDASNYEAELDDLARPR